VRPSGATRFGDAVLRLGALGLTLALAAGVRAATVIDAANNCGVPASVAICGDFSASGVVSFDLTWKSIAPVSVQVQINSAEASADVLTYNSQQTNNTGQLFDTLELQLEQADFDHVGSVLDSLFDLVPVQSASSTVASIAPGPNGDYLELGDVEGNGDPGTDDWKIGVSGLAAGETFVMRFIPAPEPASAVEGVAALAAVLGASRRGRRRPPKAASAAL
jgi:hypothetical protein